jgi:glycosyltransferase involved in cell wall biosynthesis
MSRVDRLSVVVPTRNRPDHVVDCAKSLIACGGFDELLFIDQSDDSETAVVIEELGHARVRCVRSELRGATNGRNLGIELSSGTIIAFTDDDCRVARDWTARIRDVFDDDPDAAVVCGRVHVPDELAAQGFAMSFEPLVREWQGHFPPPDRDWGITANLSVRRSVLERVGRFDPFLGPGAPLLCGEEPDLLFRVLDAGLKVVNATEVVVTHLGIRMHGEESRQLWDIYGAGTAAALFKHVRMGNTTAMRLWLQHMAKMARVMGGNLLTGRRPIGARYTVSFLSGTRESFRFGIDPVRRIYRLRSRGTKTPRFGSSRYRKVAKAPATK